MVGKKLYGPATIKGVAVIIFAPNLRANEITGVIRGLHTACQALGIVGFPPDPPVIEKGAASGSFAAVSDVDYFGH